MTSPVLPPASYPGTYKVFTTKNDGEVIYGEHANEWQEEIDAIESTVGINPQIDWNGSAYLTMTDRLTFLERDTVRLEGNQLIHGTKEFTNTVQVDGNLVGNGAPVRFNYPDRQFYFSDVGLQQYDGTGVYHDMELQPTGGQVFRAGYRMWDAGNDGPGSGLDADTLDGHQAADFLLRHGCRTTLSADQVVPHENVGDVIVDNYWRQLLLRTVTWEQNTGDGTVLFNSNGTFNITPGIWMAQWYLGWQNHPNGLRTLRGIDNSVAVNANPAATNFTTFFNETHQVNLPSYWPTSGLPTGYYLEAQQNSMMFVADHAFTLRVDVWCGSDADATLLSTSTSHLHQPTSFSLAQIA